MVAYSVMYEDTLVGLLVERRTDNSIARQALNCFLDKNQAEDWATRLNAQFASFKPYKVIEIHL